jgi:hypothetical protein
MDAVSWFCLLVTVACGVFLFCFYFALFFMAKTLLFGCEESKVSPIFGQKRPVLMKHQYLNGRGY